MRWPRSACQVHAPMPASCGHVQYTCPGCNRVLVTASVTCRFLVTEPSSMFCMGLDVSGCALCCAWGSLMLRASMGIGSAINANRPDLESNQEEHNCKALDTSGPKCAQVPLHPTEGPIQTPDSPQGALYPTPPAPLPSAHHCFTPSAASTPDQRSDSPAREEALCHIW